MIYKVPKSEKESGRIHIVSQPQRLALCMPTGVSTVI